MDESARIGKDLINQVSTGSNIGELIEALDAAGYVELRTSTSGFHRLANDLGEPVSARRGGPKVDLLVPTAEIEAKDRSLSKHFGKGQFPFHTDAAHHSIPPRYVVLRLADGSISSTPTQVVRPDFGSADSSDLALLRREQWLVRGGSKRTFYASIINPQQGFVRFDPGCMCAPGGTTLRGHEVLRATVQQREVIEIDWEEGKTLVIDNWVSLHARPETADTDRMLMRAMVVAND